MTHSFPFGHPFSARHVLGALVLAVLPLSIHGQGGATGAVQGIVRDQTGAVVTNATVQIVDSSTNLSREVETGSDGSFTANLLPAAHYKTTVRATGFSPSEFPDVDVHVTETTRLTISLKPSAVNVEVVVESRDLPDLNIANPATGETVTHPTCSRRR